MRILSLDLSTKKSGWAIIDTALQEPTLIKYGLISEDDGSIETRIWNIAQRIKRIIENEDYGITDIVYEDVPLSVSSNLQTAKYLLILQGYIRYICDELKIKKQTLYKPTEWRKIIGINRTLYICKKCKWQKEFPSTITEVICLNCGNKSKSGFEKKALNSRQELKERAVKGANKRFDLQLEYYKNDTKKHVSDDDIAEAILIGYAYTLDKH